MKTEKLILKGCNGMQLPGILWLPDDYENDSKDIGENSLRAVLQITHGMTEHMGRYEKLAEFLTSHGIAVTGFDLRGHGRNEGRSDCASFGEGGWEATLEDMHLFYRYIEGRFSGVGHIMLGFSLGSFLLREYLNRYDDKITGAVIVGTGHQPGAVLSIIMAIVKTQIRSGGFDNTTPLVQKLSFGTYNQKFAPNKTVSDWLCADEEQLEQYLQDSLCREHISSGLFWQLLAAMKHTGDKHAYDRWNKAMPILLVSGKNDPVGDFGKGIERVKSSMEKAGLKNVTMKMFEGARHDLLHEEASKNAARMRELLKDWILQISI